MIAMIAAFVVLLAIGMPMYFVLGGASLAYFFSKGLPAWTIIQRQFVGLNSFVMLAVPLFILAGNLMDSGGMMKRIIQLSKICVGRFKGGLAHVNIAASMLFAGVSGSAVADVAALGPLEIEMMESNGYEKDYAAALTCASASIGPTIPPSLPLIMYGVVSGTPIGALLIAGLVPGVLMGIALMLQVAYVARKYNFPTCEKYPLRVVIKEVFASIGAVSMPIIVLIGIYTGIFTPTEAAGIACLVAFIIGKFIYKELQWSDIPKILRNTARVLGSCTSIVAIAACFSYVISFENVPAIVSSFLTGLTSNKIFLLLIVNIVLLILGCFMEGISIILITAPLLLPTLVNAGVDPIHLGVIMTINTTLGLLTPPLGLSLFMASSITNLPILRLVKKVMPMFVLLVIFLLIITYIPQITLFLPNMMAAK